MNENEWFADWFDSPFYHILYKHRNDQEASEFIQNLSRVIDLQENASVLDLACGKGRHSLMLHRCGYDVMGVDLSANSIDEAKHYEQSGLRFAVHDMRKALHDVSFDAVFNLFTSFGYFDDQGENLQVMQAVQNMLNPGGCFIIDFLNAEMVRKNLIPEEEMQIDGINFYITRWLTEQHVFKSIQFEHEGQHYRFRERVQLLTLGDFQSLLHRSGFEIDKVWGNYKLEEFDSERSPRLIMMANKR
jgi:SAM-dependent methyltransferase